MRTLQDRRILIVGASSGIGLATAQLLSEAGARVALAARRRERLEEAARKAPGEAVAVPCDVRDPAACERAVEQSVEVLGGLDAVVYATGAAAPRPIVELGAEAWRETFEVNVIGATLITRAALPHLSRARGNVVFLSSIAASEEPPRPSMSLYCVSKAALDRLLGCWRNEHRDVAFTRVVIGDTDGTEFGVGWDPSQLEETVARWAEGGYMFGRAMAPGSVAEQIVSVLRSDEAVPSLTVVPRYVVE